jgi:hypothetical protein
MIEVYSSWLLEPDINIDPKDALSVSKIYERFPSLRKFRPIIDFVLISIVMPLVLFPIALAIGLTDLMGTHFKQLRIVSDLEAKKGDLRPPLLFRCFYKYNKLAFIITDLNCRPPNSPGGDIICQDFPGDREHAIRAGAYVIIHAIFHYKVPVGLYEGLLALIDYLDVYNSLCNAHSWII